MVIHVVTQFSTLRGFKLIDDKYIYENKLEKYQNLQKAQRNYKCN